MFLLAFDLLFNYLVVTLSFAFIIIFKLLRFKVLGLSVGLRWMHFKFLKDYEGQKGGVILRKFKGLMCVGFVHFKFQALKNS